MFMSRLSLVVILFLTFLTSCAPYRYSTDWIESEPRKNNHPLAKRNKTYALSHPLYMIIPRYRNQIQWYDMGHWTTWVLFGNEKDGIFGEEAAYRPMQLPSFSKALSWYVRNPLHNFNSYVIGDAGRRQSSLILFGLAPHRFALMTYQEQAKTIFPSRGSCLYLALHGWKPFFSLRIAYSRHLSTDFYIGWRCGGSFGLKFHLIKKHNEYCN